MIPRTPLSKGAEKFEQIELFEPPPVGDSEILAYLLRKWSRYETGIKPTTLGAIYGAHVDLDEFHRKMSVRPGCRRQDEEMQMAAWLRIRHLQREGKIIANPDIITKLAKLGA